MIKLQKLKENKALKIIWNIVYTLFYVLVVLMLLAVVLQRVSNNSISLGGYRLFSVLTGSMAPEYNVGDILIAKEIKPEDIKVGDDIVYVGNVDSFSNKIVTHRVIETKNENGEYRFITQGIANTEQDPEIGQDQIYGKVIYKMQIISSINKMISNIYIFYFVIFIPIALIIFKQIKNIIDSKEDDDRESNDEDK